MFRRPKATLDLAGGGTRALEPRAIHHTAQDSPSAKPRQHHPQERPLLLRHCWSPCPPYPLGFWAPGVYFPAVPRAMTWVSQPKSSSPHPGCLQPLVAPDSVLGAGAAAAARHLCLAGPGEATPSGACSPMKSWPGTALHPQCAAQSVFSENCPFLGASRTMQVPHVGTGTKSLGCFPAAFPGALSRELDPK